ncbi:hypothetical protein OsJ_24976 [Oryza sativa Japonica Group]|uniref:Uncharacterized protein n=1 Tax=Oryza sativa subsp. japonica TaxID=39947 RepID=B9FY83_ORYSJ|nr:hypothetical protein OsJ_24976 [Oryza sativa Japonica Group]
MEEGLRALESLYKNAYESSSTTAAGTSPRKNHHYNDSDDESTQFSMGDVPVTTARLPSHLLLLRGNGIAKSVSFSMADQGAAGCGVVRKSMSFKRRCRRDVVVPGHKDAGSGWRRLAAPLRTAAGSGRAQTVTGGTAVDGDATAHMSRRRVVTQRRTGPRAHAAVYDGGGGAEQDHAMENHIMARTKFVFASTFAASTLGYSVAIAYSLSGRAAKMSLIRPRADHVAGTPTNFRGPDRWETGDDPRLRIHLPSFLCLSRYKILVKVWVAFAIATVMVVLFTFILIWGPPKQKDLMHREMRQRGGNGGGDGNNRVQEP